MLKTMTRAAAAAATALMLGACAQTGSLGDILGGVLNSPNGGQQVSATVSGVDSRAQQVFLRQQDGSILAVSYDSRTQVVYQNQNYSVTSLENGDQVTVRIQSSGNNTYYTDYIQVNQSANTSGTVNSGSGQLYSMSGNVRQVDRTNGWFTIDTQNGTVTVQMPYNPRSTDLNKFNSLRSGDYVQLQAYYLSSSRYQLASFY